MPELNQTTILRETVLPRVDVNGSLATSQEGVRLINDSDSPGANKVYGTDSNGNRGWKPDPSDDLSESFPEDFGAVGDGVADDAEALQEWINYVCNSDNEVVGKTRAKRVYATSTNLTLTVGNTGANIQSLGTIKAISGSAITELISVIGKGNTYLELRVDVNNITDCVGVGIRETSGSAGHRPKYEVYVKNAPIGVLIEDNIEGVEIDVYADLCTRAVKVTEQASETPDELKLNIVAFQCGNVFTTSDADGVSGSCTIHSEAGGDTGLAIIEQGTGTWVYNGYIRGAENAVNVSGNSYLASFNNLVIHPSSAEGLQVQVDATTCIVKGDIHIVNSINTLINGAWIKSCANGSSLQLTIDQKPNGYGLKLGDAANSKLVAYFTLMPGSKLGSMATDQAVVLDYAQRCIIEAGFFDSGISIPDNAKSRFNLIKLINSTTPITIAGSGSNENLIRFIRQITTTQRDAIANPKRGYRCDAVDDGNVMLQMNYNENTSLWE